MVKGLLKFFGIMHERDRDGFETQSINEGGIE